MDQLEGISLACHLQVNATLQDSFLKGFQLIELAARYRENGQTQPAGEVLIQAIQVANAIASESGMRESLLREIASEYAKANQFDRALQVAEAITIPFYRADALTAIVGAYAKAGKTEQAEKLAAQGVQNIPDPAARSALLSSLAAVYANAGQFESALRFVNQIELEFFRLDGLAEIAAAYAKAGQREPADRIFADVLPRAKAFIDPSIRETILSGIVRRLVAAEKRSEALEIAQSPEIGNYRDFAFTEVTRAYADAQQFDQALKVAAELKDAFPKSRALMAIAEGYRKAGQPQKAREFLDQALTVAQQITDSTAKLIQISELTGKYAELGQSDKARELAQSITDPAERDRWTKLLKCARP
jgi:tetratricopeptide (TPR) repeat protein